MKKIFQLNLIIICMFLLVSCKKDSFKCDPGIYSTGYDNHSMYRSRDVSRLSASELVVFDNDEVYWIAIDEYAVRIYKGYIKDNSLIVTSYKNSAPRTFYYDELATFNYDKLDKSDEYQLDKHNEEEFNMSKAAYNNIMAFDKDFHKTDFNLQSLFDAGRYNPR